MRLLTFISLLFASFSAGFASDSFSSDELRQLGSNLLNVSHKHDHSKSVADDYSPVGVMGAHIHGKGDWMLSYRYMEMRMTDNRNHRRNVSRTAMLQRYMVMPKWMEMKMHMFGAMYAPTDNLTLMAMIPYIYKEMKHTNRASIDFETKSQGFGDFKISGFYSLWKQHNHSIHLNLGVSLPTGSVDKKDNTLPSTPRARLPYPMQLGSGTIDYLPGVTYIGESENLSWGIQSIETIRTGKNRHSYRLGNQHKMTSWIARRWSDSLSQSVRVEWNYWDNITGHDRRLNRNMVPTADPDKRGGKRIDLLMGFNWVVFKEQLLSIEAGIPVEQSLSGPQLSTDFIGTLGWQTSF